MNKLFIVFGVLSLGIVKLSIADTPGLYKPNFHYQPASMNSLQVAGSNTLKAGETLTAGKRLTSANGRYILSMQSEDGHLCVYRFENGQQGEFVWGTEKFGFNNSRLVLQTDGNLVVSDGNGTPVWASGTHPHFNAKFGDPNNQPVKLILENDGRLNLYTASGWSCYL